LDLNQNILQKTHYIKFSANIEPLSFLGTADSGTRDWGRRYLALCPQWTYLTVFIGDIFDERGSWYLA